MKNILLIWIVATAAHAVTYSDLVKEEWNLFKIRHDKAYSNAVEDRLRMMAFVKNMIEIDKHNAKFEMGLTTYKMAPNHFSDMLPDEHNTLFGLKWPTNVNKSVGSTFITPHHVKLPDHVDWRQLGAVSAVKNQGSCGSCWAFSATGSMEGQHFRKTGKLLPLSEQNLIDCSRQYGNHGCSGGWMTTAFKYIMNNGGIDTDSTYPYEGKDNYCRFKKANVGAINTGFQNIRFGDEEMLKAAVATKGPVSVVIFVGSSFIRYQTGLYYEPNCETTAPNHGVLIVGYGTTEDGLDYWLVKNSWGAYWGENGYIKMARNKKNNCGIASYATYPLV